MTPEQLQVVKRFLSDYNDVSQVGGCVQELCVVIEQLKQEKQDLEGYIEYLENLRGGI